jgi:fermentation-respiration switch protein FrsA (DUF1100 family)
MLVADKPASTSKPFYKSKVLWSITSGILALMLIIYVGVSVYGAYAFTQVPDRVATFVDTPAKYGLAYQEISFPSAAKDQLTMRGWWVANPLSDKALIIVNGKAQTRMERLDLSKPFWDMGYNLLFFDLRGHGASDGDHYYFGQMESWDTVGAFNYVKSKGFAPENIGLFGTSMGAATSLLALGRSSEIQTVFSDSAFADLEQLATERLPIEKGLPSFFMPGIFVAGRILLDFDVNQTRPETVLSQVQNRHIFLTHGDADNTVPIREFYRLKAVGGSNIVGTWVVAGADHTQAHDLFPQEYLQKVETFFKDNLGRKG